MESLADFAHDAYALLIFVHVKKTSAKQKISKALTAQCPNGEKSKASWQILPFCLCQPIGQRYGESSKELQTSEKLRYPFPWIKTVIPGAWAFPRV